VRTSEESATTWAAVGGVAAAVAAGGTGLLLLVNHYGPFGEARSPGALAALGGALVAGTLTFVVVRSAARRSRTLLAVVVAAMVTTGWVLLPRQIDVSESWVPRPNERYSCTGWSFEYYPPETFDASATTYCIGLEHRIADG